MLEKHPELVLNQYAMYDAFVLGPEGLECRPRGSHAVPQTRKEAMRGETYQVAYDRLLEAVASAEKQKKIPFIKEHVYFFMDPRIVVQNIPQDVPRTVKACPVVVDRNVPSSISSGSYKSPTSPPAARKNPTILPDSFLNSMTPLILFRHPALMIPSFYRAAQKGKIEISIYDEHWPVNASLRWLRLVYDWYRDATGKSARSVIVIDSDDLINSPGFSSHLFASLGIDQQHLQTSWEPKSEAYRADKGHRVNSFKSTLWDSTRIIRGKRRDYEIDVAAEQEKLREEFGDEVGNIMARYIDLAMGDYHYLRERRFH